METSLQMNDYPAEQSKSLRSVFKTVLMHFAAALQVVSSVLLCLLSVLYSCINMYHCFDTSE